MASGKGPTSQNADTLGNRAADNWRELYRIGMVVGGTWPARLEAAALAMSGVKNVMTLSDELLRDIKAVLDRLSVAAIHTHTLINELAKEEDRPWGTYNKNSYDKSINPKQLSGLLNDYGISPKTVDIRIGGQIDSRKGYKRDQFEEAFTRYCNSSEQKFGDVRRSDGRPKNVRRQADGS